MPFYERHHGEFELSKVSMQYLFKYTFHDRFFVPSHSIENNVNHFNCFSSRRVLLQYLNLTNEEYSSCREKLEEIRDNKKLNEPTNIVEEFIRLIDDNNYIYVTTTTFYHKFGIVKKSSKWGNIELFSIINL